MLEIRSALLLRPERFPAGWMVGDVGVHGQLQLGALFPYRVQPRVVEVQPLVSRQLLALNARALVGDLAHASGALAIASLELLHDALPEIRLIRALGVERA